MSNGLSRRAVLRGIGVSMTLPWFESIARASGGMSAPTGLRGESLAGARPVRMACVFMPNGVNYESWTPIADGAGYLPSKTLEPLAAVRQHVSVLTGLTLNKARANGDGPGDHARSSASFLTGHQARKTAGNDIRNGVSVDQLAARKVGNETRLSSLEVGCENSPSAGSCDSGYSCAYTSNISWRAEDVPMPKLVDPAAVFERLFGDASQAAAQRERIARKRSVLDFVAEDTRSLRSRLGRGDTHKLDQFQNAVREVELRLDRARRESDGVKLPDTPAPAGIPRTAGAHIDLLYDMLLLAFQSDTTRVATFMLGVDGSNRAFPEIGIKEGHHQLSHHQNNAEMVEKIRRIDRFHIERFARFVQRLSDTPDGSGSLLDNSMILFGGGISDGNRHNHENLPVLLAGRAGGTLLSGRLIESPPETPLCNLYVSMLERMRCEAESFGDSTGALRAIDAG